MMTAAAMFESNVSARSQSVPASVLRGQRPETEAFSTICCIHSIQQQDDECNSSDTAQRSENKFHIYHSTRDVSTPLTGSWTKQCRKCTAPVCSGALKHQPLAAIDH
ncbi:uncharacterized protein V6R79_024532 [Siganus canaliculatus]